MMPKELELSPKVSVVMPMYNAEKHVAQAIESILSQTHNDLEFIIINDASTDGSLEIANKYAELDNRIKIIDLEHNQGIAKALNTGIGLAVGEYIARMDADDISMPKRLEKQLKFMDDNPECGICGSWIKSFNGVNQKTEVSETPLDHNSIKAELIFMCAFSHPTVIFRKKVITDDALYKTDYIPAEDYELWTRMAAKTKLANLPEVLLHYRVHDESISKRENNKQVLQANRVREDALAELGLVPTISQLRIHDALCNGNKIYLLERKNETSDWLETLTNENKFTRYTSTDSMQTKINSIKNELRNPDSRYLVYFLRTYIPVFKFFNKDKSLAVAHRMNFLWPKELIKKTLWK